METKHNHIKLTSAELSYLWSTYLADSMSTCVFKCFLENIEDENIKSLITHTLDLSQQHIETIQDIFLEEKIQIPQGFTEQDVNLKTKRLFLPNSANEQCSPILAWWNIRTVNFAPITRVILLW